MTFRDFAPVLYRALMMIVRWLERHGLNKEQWTSDPLMPQEETRTQPLITTTLPMDTTTLPVDTETQAKRE